MSTFISIQNKLIQFFSHLNVLILIGALILISGIIIMLVSLLIIARRALRRRSSHPQLQRISSISSPIHVPLSPLPKARFPPPTSSQSQFDTSDSRSNVPSPVWRSEPHHSWVNASHILGTPTAPSIHREFPGAHIPPRLAMPLPQIEDYPRQHRGRPRF
jgi:hypothetical protein